MNLIDFFERSAALYPDRIALEFEGRKWTYSEVEQMANRVANGLRQIGVGRGSKCAVASRNDPHAFIAFLGILKTGAAWVPVTPTNALSENIELIRAFEVEVLFYQHEFRELAERVNDAATRIHQFCLDGSPSTVGSLETWASSYSDSAAVLPWDPDGLCMLRGTGGTTGKPKGVMNTNRNLETTIANYAVGMKLRKPPVYLACAPLTHAATIFAMIAIAHGGTVVIQRSFELELVLRTIGQRRISMLYLPPTAIYMVLGLKDVRSHDYSSLTHFIYGAAPMSSARLREALEVFGPVMTQSYGQTETPTSVTFLAPEDHFLDDGTIAEHRLLSCGRPGLLSRVALMDEEGNFVRQGDVGEIVVQGGLVMRGYFNDPVATKEVSQFGWHHTGDLAYQDKDGYFYICDRKKEMIITGGFNVYPAEVEQVLLTHPAVQDCAVIGVPDEKWGEAVTGVIEPKPGSAIDQQEMLRYCKDRLGAVKAPKSIRTVEQLPRSSAGKVLRKEVRKIFWKAASRNVN